MSKPVAVFRTDFSALTVGERPRVVGTLSSLDWGGKLEGDIVEVRLDLLAGRTDWLEQCAALQVHGKPVLLTARLAAEGGQWPRDDQRRFEGYQSALRKLAAVDVELSSAICPDVAATARKLQKACIVSYHHFQKTPSLEELQGLVRKGQQIGSVVKISTMIQSEADVATLRSLLAGKWERPLCVIGMGSRWSETRVAFARLGSCLTYGYLDKPAAPGQIAAAELAAQLKRMP